MSATIRAAGGVVYRGSRRSLRVAVIHRPHRNDWSLPKGRLHQHERAVRAAYREVVEETGLIVAVQNQFQTVRYRVDRNRKTVTYWAMRHVGGEFIPNDEADQLRWLSITDASKLLTFPSDRSVIEAFGERDRADSAVLVVRHAKAGKRSAWKKDDTIRPLDAVGRRQAQAIASFGALFAPERIYAATPLRCAQTVQPLAEGTGVALEADAAFSDKEFHHSPAASLERLQALGSTQSVDVVCSQGSTIPGLLDALDPHRKPHDSRKGSVWVLFFSRGELLQADYYARPS